MENLCDVIGCHPRHSINFSKFAEENDLAVARFERLSLLLGTGRLYLGLSGFQHIDEA
jgi:hypothetical protein